MSKREPIETPIERSSLGTPDVKRLREQAPREIVDAILARLSKEDAFFCLEPIKLLIAYDGKSFFVRRVRVTTHDLDKDEKVYHCDEHLGGPFESITAAAHLAEVIIARDKSMKSRNSNT